MLSQQFLVVALLAVQCSADGKLGVIGGWGLGGGLGGGLGVGGGLGLGGGIGLIGGGVNTGLAAGGRVNAAILSSRAVQVVPVGSTGGIAAPTVVDVDSTEQPVVLNFLSRSSALSATQQHIGQAGSNQASHSVDEPHRLTHEVLRPVIQVVREVVVPERNIIQEIRPVIENVQSVVAQGQGRVGGLGIAGAGVGGAGLAIGGGAGLGIGGGWGGKGVIGGGWGGKLSKW